MSAHPHLRLMQGAHWAFLCEVIQQLTKLHIGINYCGGPEGVMSITHFDISHYQFRLFSLPTSNLVISCFQFLVFSLPTSNYTNLKLQFSLLNDTSSNWFKAFIFCFCCAGFRIFHDNYCRNDVQILAISPISLLFLIAANICSTLAFAGAALSLK